MLAAGTVIGGGLDSVSYPPATHYLLLRFAQSRKGGIFRDVILDGYDFESWRPSKSPS